MTAPWPLQPGVELDPCTTPVQVEEAQRKAAEAAGEQQGQPKAGPVPAKRRQVGQVTSVCWPPRGRHLLLAHPASISATPSPAAGRRASSSWTTDASRSGEVEEWTVQPTSLHLFTRA